MFLICIFPLKIIAVILIKFHFKKSISFILQKIKWLLHSKEDWPSAGFGEGREVGCNSWNLQSEAAASVQWLVDEQSLCLCGSQSSPSSNSNVCLLVFMLLPVSFDWQVELCALDAASETDVWSDGVFELRHFLLLPADRLSEFLYTLPGWREGSFVNTEQKEFKYISLCVLVFNMQQIMQVKAALSCIYKSDAFLGHCKQKPYLDFSTSWFNTLAVSHDGVMCHRETNSCDNLNIFSGLTKTRYKEMFLWGNLLSTLIPHIQCN